MYLKFDNAEVKLNIVVKRDGNRVVLSKGKKDKWTGDGIEVELRISSTQLIYGMQKMSYEMYVESKYEDLVNIELENTSCKDAFHLIPGNIHGDNNIKHAQSGEFPILTTIKSEDNSFSERWHFRADRASHPVSIIACDNGILGISVNQYLENGDYIVRNGLIAQLPSTIGVSIGYENYPVTFNNKRDFHKSTSHKIKKGSINGNIYYLNNEKRISVHKIIRDLYFQGREKPEYKNKLDTAAKAIMKAFVKVNWSEEFKEYSNCHCEMPKHNKLKPWRPLVEIGWTGGGVLGYPFAVSEYLFELDDNFYGDKKDSKKIFDNIADSYNEKSGFLNDVIRPWNIDMWPESNVNGWWCYFGMVKDRHGAYTNGSGLFYMLKTYRFYKHIKNIDNEKWLDVSLKVLDNLVELQRYDGSYGFSYSTQKKEVLDWDGFAGCWFVGGMLYGYLETKDDKYLYSAKKALEYYYEFVKNLSCWGTPMDTWKSVDEEGNLAFIRGAKLMHQITKEKHYLDMLEDGAEYEYLWKYSFKAKPQYKPLKDSVFNSCGGSVTSVSNPHIHPMGSMVVSDLYYLYKETKDEYHLMRCEDTLAWSMHILELYPQVTGYGVYGVLSERFCPSDGLIEPIYSNKELGSTWLTFNGWAGANVLEGICETILIDKHISEDYIL